MSHWDFGRPPAGQQDEPGPPSEIWPGDNWSDEGWRDDEGTMPYPVTYERDPFVPAPAQPQAPPRETYEPWAPAPRPGAPADTGGRTDRVPDPGRPDQEPGWPPDQEPGEPEDDWAQWADLEGGGRGRGRGRPGGRGGGRRWAVAVVVLAGAVSAAAVLLTGSHPGAQRTQGGRRAGASAAPAAPAAPKAASASPATSASAAGTGALLTMAQAQAVLGAYTTANNDANAQRSDALLGMIETGSSYAIDAGLYQTRQAEGAAPYPPFSAVQATYYIPRGEAAGGPRWFVVQVANAFQSDREQVTSAEYLLFTQPAAGAAWQDAVEPYLLPGASVPRLAVGADGLATAVGPGAADAVAPGQLAAVTAASLDGTASGQAAVADPGNLADRADQRTWQAMVPGGAVTDAHSPAAGADGQEFALLTTDGGALVFYTDAAEVTITPPAGSPLGVTVPGLYAAAQVLPQAGVSYLEQFAAYDPPAGTGAPRVVADYSAITGKN